MHKETIIRNFSRYAHKYDSYADVQKMAALRLLESIKGLRPKRILEFGCGTGNYTSLLRERFCASRIKAVDFSAKMVEVAERKLSGKDVEFFVEDAEDIKYGEEFDLITSNACFQWFEDPARAVIKYKGMLDSAGVIAFSVFGPRTFWELNESLNNVLGDAVTGADSFMPKAKVEKILSKNFCRASIEELEHEESFSSLKDLLNKIKYTGTRGPGLNSKGLLSARRLKKLEEFYLNNFSLKATYQIFICKGAK